MDGAWPTTWFYTAQPLKLSWRWSAAEWSHPVRPSPTHPPFQEGHPLSVGQPPPRLIRIRVGPPSAECCLQA